MVTWAQTHVKETSRLILAADTPSLELGNVPRADKPQPKRRYAIFPRFLETVSRGRQGKTLRNGKICTPWRDTPLGATMSPPKMRSIVHQSTHARSSSSSSNPTSSLFGILGDLHGMQCMSCPLTGPCTGVIADHLASSSSYSVCHLAIRRMTHQLRSRSFPGGEVGESAACTGLTSFSALLRDFLEVLYTLSICTCGPFIVLLHSDPRVLGSPVTLFWCLVGYLFLRVRLLET